MVSTSELCNNLCFPKCLLCEESCHYARICKHFSNFTNIFQINLNIRCFQRLFDIWNSLDALSVKFHDLNVYAPLICGGMRSFNKLEFTKTERHKIQTRLNNLSVSYERNNRDETKCKCTLKRKFIKNPAGRKSGHPYQLEQYRAVFAVRHGWVPLWPGTVSHLCHLRNCIEPEHLVAESTSANISRNQCKKELKRIKTKGAILKCTRHTPCCFLN